MWVTVAKGSIELTTELQGSCWVLVFFPICILFDLSKPSLKFHQKLVGITSSPELYCYLPQKLHLSSEIAAFCYLVEVFSLCIDQCCFLCTYIAQITRHRFQQMDWEFIPGPAVYHKQPRSRRQGLKETRPFNNKLVMVSLFRSHTDTVHLVGNLKKEETMAPLIGHGAQSLWGYRHSANSAGRPPPNRTSIQYGYDDLPDVYRIFLVNILMLVYR